MTDPTTGVKVKRRNGQRAVVAERTFSSGEAILPLRGVVVPQPNRYTIQLGAAEHLDGSEPDPERAAAAFPWRFLNHRCDPNAAVRGRELVALRPIAPGDEVTFDYSTTEFDMAEPFDCRCGVPACLGRVRGYLHLTPAQRRAREGRVAPHVVALLPAEAAAT